MLSFTESQEILSEEIATLHLDCFWAQEMENFMWGGTFINYDCWFDLADDIFIGENCNIAMNVHFVNATHEMGDKTRRAGRGITKPINIGSGSWIGADSIIMPGVCIGTGCIIGAGSLVLHDTDDNSIYIGRPAQKYKQIE